MLAEIRCERIFALRERSSVLVQESRCEKPVVAVESADYLDILPQERRAVHRGKDILGKSGNRHQCGARRRGICSSRGSRVKLRRRSSQDRVRCGLRPA